ncbi:MAG: DMT family transporter [Gammaproteobacteria bacterium]|nr:EamA family transporter [Gammaproteobacteria bacterium]
MPTTHRRALLQIHICVVLWGFTAILGKLISLAALPLVWWRMVLVAALLLLVPAFWRGLPAMQRSLLATYAGIGTFVALHWLTFYGSVKLSNASVAATCMALTPVFTAFVEPMLARRRIDPVEVLFGLAVIPGVAMVTGGTPTQMRLGILVGTLSAFFVAIFGSLNKRYIGSSPVLTVTGIEIGAGAAFLALFGSVLSPSTSVFVLPGWQDALLLIALAVGCTLLPFALSLVALRRLSAFSASLAVNLEPVYAIVLAIVLLGEQRELAPTFYLGVLIILAVVFSHPLWVSRGKRAQGEAASVAAGADRHDRDTIG